VQPFLTIAEAGTAEGAKLTLHRRGKEFFLRVNGQALMGTNAPESERMLAELGCAGLRGKRGVRVLIGGLGFGFTLRAVLELLGEDGLVEVAELLPEVVAWNREHLAEVNGLLVDDSRVRMVLGDVYDLMVKGEAERYDAILLDVDNGPVAMVQEGNGRMYQADGLAMIWRVLKPGGCVAFWSASGDPAFVRRLAKAGFAVQVEAVKAYAQAKRKVHTIFLGRRK
jgi:spermidine synthase